MVALVLVFAGLILVLGGLAATIRGHPRRGCLLTIAPSNIITGEWVMLAARLTAAAVHLWLLWRNRRRRKRAPRAYGAKSWARITALTRKAREAARPRPVRRLAPQGG